MNEYVIEAFQNRVQIMTLKLLLIINNYYTVDRSRKQQLFLNSNQNPNLEFPQLFNF